ncbi:hypothetical protein ANASTE_00171, partial [Anaerofustis stercorihominis DSM 17244]
MTYIIIIFLFCKGTTTKDYIALKFDNHIEKILYAFYFFVIKHLKSI